MRLSSEKTPKVLAGQFVSSASGSPKAASL